MFAVLRREVREGQGDKGDKEKKIEWKDVKGESGGKN